MFVLLKVDQCQDSESCLTMLHGTNERAFVTENSIICVQRRIVDFSLFQAPPPRPIPSIWAGDYPYLYYVLLCRYYFLLIGYVKDKNLSLNEKLVQNEVTLKMNNDNSKISNFSDRKRNMPDNSLDHFQNSWQKMFPT